MLPSDCCSDSPHARIDAPKSWPLRGEGIGGIAGTTTDGVGTAGVRWAASAGANDARAAITATDRSTVDIRRDLGGRW